MSDPIALLARARAIAVVGFSRDPEKEAHEVPLAVARRGWRVIPVNPHADEIAGLACCPTLAAAARVAPLDLVNVFRPASDAPQIARDAAAAGARALWLQTGIRSAQARRIATDAGMDYVEDACIRTVAAYTRPPPVER